MDVFWLLAGFLVLLIALVLSVFALLVYSGLFEAIDVKTGKPPIGNVTIAYKDGRGPYKNCGSFFCESTIIGPQKKQIGIYYDDPDVVPQEKLRWAVGAIIAENDEPVDEAARAAFEKEDYKFMTLPGIPTSVNCVFPYVTNISIVIAVKRVFPALKRYIQTHGLQTTTCLEICYGGYLHYMMPLSEDVKFFTPVALEAGEEEANEEHDSETTTVAEEKSSEGSTAATTIAASEEKPSAVESSTVTALEQKPTESEPKKQPEEDKPSDVSSSPKEDQKDMEDEDSASADQKVVIDDTEKPGAVTEELAKDTAREEQDNDSDESFEKVETSDVTPDVVEPATEE